MSCTETTCPYCGVGCGLNVNVDEQSQGSKSPLIFTSKTHPANFGRVCSKGSALGETLVSNESARVAHPEIDGNSVTWDVATQTIADRIQASIEQYGKESIAFYLSGQLLTEDYYVANKLMKGFIGTANVDTNSRLCMSSAVAAYKRAFGADAVPCSYEDLELADLIVLIGSNAAWTHPVLYQRMLEAKQTNPRLKIVLIDPRKTASVDIADLHLQIVPSSDGFLFQGLLNYLVNNGYIDESFISQHTEGFEASAELARLYSVSVVAEQTKVSKLDLEKFYQLFSSTEKAISFYSQGINQSATGTDKCNAIINCHLASGKIGYPGAGPFSITGQPNAMGGREVGGLANMLAAHMDFAPDDLARVQRFWYSPTIAEKPGLKAVDLFAAMHSGKIKVLWIMATNPAVSLPNSNHVREALSRCETVIVSDVTHTDTTGYADILLPALAWGEKNGTVTNSERRISRQRAFQTGPGTAKADWWAVSKVAEKLGYGDQFAYNSSRDVFVEHAALSGFENGSDENSVSEKNLLKKRCFDISGLANLDQVAYDSLQPIQWPVNRQNPNGTERLFTDKKFYTKTGKAQFISGVPKHAQAIKESNTKLLLNTGRLRDQWHTMTRTGIAPSLTSHGDVPFVEVNSVTAAEYGLQHNNFAALENKNGKIVVRINVSDSVAKGELFAPIHWNTQFATESVVNSLIQQIVDPVSGQPESKVAAVELSHFDCAYWVRLMTKHFIPQQSQFAYWASSYVGNGYVTLVGHQERIDWGLWLKKNLLVNSYISHYTNSLTESQSWLLTHDENIGALVFSGHSAAQLPSQIWLIEQFSKGYSDSVNQLLRNEQGERDTLICACFKTSLKQIEFAYNAGSLSPQELAEQLGCGSKCGSCKPEINQLLVNLKG